MKLGKHSYCKNPIVRGDPRIEIGNYTAIADPCTFVGVADHPSIEHPKLVPNYPFNDVPCGFAHNIDYPECGGKQNINIGNDVWIGFGCTIRGGITIGDGAIIGMKSVVAKNIPPYAIAVGNPVVIKKYRFVQPVIEKLLKIKWWDWNHETIIKRIEDLKDINKFIKKYGK